MSISITPIGVNDAFTTKGFQTNYLVESGDARLLVDCGTTAATALDQLGLALIDIDSVYISHLHLDHVGGLIQLGFQRFVAKRERPKIYLHHSLAPIIWDHFLVSGMGAYLDNDGTSRSASPDTFFDFIPLDKTIDNSEEPISVGDINFSMVPVNHGFEMPIFGVILDNRVFLTADTIFLPELLERVANTYAIEAIFHDCSFNPDMQKVHATYEQLCSLPEDLKEMIIGVHYEVGAEGKLDGKPEIKLGEAGRKYEY